MESNFNHTDCYFQYIQKVCPSLSIDALSYIAAISANTSWENPKSALDFNNIAVVALIEAEQCENLDLRATYLDMAFEALNSGSQMDNHPLRAIHLAVLYNMVGDEREALNTAYTVFLKSLQAGYTATEKIPLGLFYLPANRKISVGKRYEQIENIFQSKDGYTQSFLILGEVLCQSNLYFYNLAALQMLQIAIQLLPDSAYVNFKLGIANLVNGRLEGILNLHRTRKILLESAFVIQALYLAYRDAGELESADFWFNYAREFHQQNSESLNWRWAALAVNSQFTYVPFDGSLLMAVEASFHSLVTSVLIAEGDWFEKEMEFWRSWLQPGMIVIDVGANVGVYTFSAARRVGSSGRVLAVEPFSACVSFLSETCRINNLSWVKICAGAASDRNGTKQLSLHTHSELNKVTLSDTETATELNSSESVTCFSLDSLAEQENLSHVDFIKIDVEGHEMQVLIGSEQILNQFFPIIIYEHNGNFSVANFLTSKGYQLFYYKPYVQQLIPIKDAEDFQSQLNIIALHPATSSMR